MDKLWKDEQETEVNVRTSNCDRRKAKEESIKNRMIIDNEIYIATKSHMTDLKTNKDGDVE